MIRFCRNGDATYDVATKAPTFEDRAWMRDHHQRMRVYASSPWFDTLTSWYPSGLAYQDAYALYVKDTDAFDYRILRGPAGEPLFIPFGAKPYAQYAANIFDGGVRREWINTARTRLARGARGLFVDDVNYYRRVARADGSTPPGDDRAWREQMADFMWEIRCAFPGVEIVHNVIWQVPETPDVLEGYKAADLINREAGAVDSGLTGGTGRFSLRALLAWVDRRHAGGQGVIWDANAKADTLAKVEYNLACHLLTCDDRDYVGSRVGGSRQDWFAKYDYILGEPVGPRFDTDTGLISRSFEHGFVTVNEPGTVTRGGLAPASGVVSGVVALPPT